MADLDTLLAKAKRGDRRAQYELAGALYAKGCYAQDANPAKAVEYLEAAQKYYKKAGKDDDYYAQTIQYMLPDLKKNAGIEEAVKVVFNKEYDCFSLVKGCVKLGFFGTFSTEDIEYTCYDDVVGEVLDTEDDDVDSTYYPLKKVLHKGMTKRETAQALTDYYNARIASMKEHQVELNQMLLAYVLKDWCDKKFNIFRASYDYGREVVLKEWRGNRMELFYNEKAVCEVNKLYEKYYNTTHNKEVINDRDAEEVVRKYFTAFDLNKFLERSEQLEIRDGSIKVCISDIEFEVTTENGFRNWKNYM